MAERIDLRRETLRLTKQIPKGKISTYGALAEALGDKAMARFVGMALSENPTPGKIPCHRVVHSNGRTGGYKLGVEKKMKLLRREGIELKSGMVVNFKKHFFKNFKTK